MEAGKQEAQGRSLLAREVYCVCFPLRDGLETLQGELAAARRKFFQGGKKTVKVGRHEVVKGFDGDLRGKLSHWTFYWKKCAKNVADGKRLALEEAYDQKGGYVLVIRDFQGVIVSRVFFDKGHAWQKSEYYEPWDSGTARVLFKPDPLEDAVERFDWDGEKQLYRSVLLRPTPYRPGTAEQALVNARLGEPQLLVSVEEGCLCYCTPEEAEAREKAYDEIQGGTMVLMPAWEVKEGAYAKEPPPVTFPGLDAYAHIDAPEEERQEPPSALPPQAPGEEEEPDSGMSLELILADAGQASPALEEEQEAPPTKEAPPAPPRDEGLILRAARRAFGWTAKGRPAPGAAGEGLPGQAPAPEALPPAEQDDVLEAARRAAEPPEGSHAGDMGQPSPTPRHTEGRGQPEEEPPPQPGPAQEPPQIRVSPPPAAIRITPEDGPGPQHTGRGRSVQENGLTAYEGDYQDGKRQGFGSHYYKSGDLSYAGFWQEGKKDGLGASFREGDHALHVSRWTDGRPGKVVSLFDKGGSLRFGGRIENGKKHGAGVSISAVDGSVLVSKWDQGENTGLASAFDPEGNLLYYGSWKDGKRHGHGTEFDRSGGIVFDGEWRDDQYFNGILYQRPDAEPPETEAEALGPDWEL